MQTLGSFCKYVMFWSKNMDLILENKHYPSWRQIYGIDFVVGWCWAVAVTMCLDWQTDPEQGAQQTLKFGMVGNWLSVIETYWLFHCQKLSFWQLIIIILTLLLIRETLETNSHHCLLSCQCSEIAKHGKFWFECKKLQVSLPHLLTHWGWDKMAAIFKTTFSNGFSWM